MAVPLSAPVEVGTTAEHLEFLVEEPSMEAFLRVALPRMIPGSCSFNIHPFRGKSDLLRKLPGRLRGYQRWIPPNYRIVVLVDRDDQDCHVLKADLEAAAGMASLLTRSQAGVGQWQIANRIVIEELEAWYFGDWGAVRRAYPRVSPNIPLRVSYRDPDAIRGGTATDRRASVSFEVSWRRRPGHETDVGFQTLPLPTVWNPTGIPSRIESALSTNSDKP